MNATPARIAEARAISAELGIPAEAVTDETSLVELIESARNTNHLRTILRSEAIDSGFLDGPSSNGELTAEQIASVDHDALARQLVLGADTDEEDDDTTDADEEDADDADEEDDDTTDSDEDDDPESDWSDLTDALRAAYKVAGFDATLAALKKLATPRTRAARTPRQPRGEATLRYSKDVDPALLPTGTVRARVHKDGDTSAVLAVVKLATAGADRARFTPATADEADYGWGVLCLAHGTTSMQKTRRDARRLSMTPAKFCTGCAAAH